MTLTENKRFLDFAGITKWHEAGYTGKGTLFASAERFSLAAIKSLGYRGIAPVANYQPGDDSHALKTALSFFTIAPDATLAMLPLSNDPPHPNFFDAYDVIKDCGILGAFDSTGGSPSPTQRMAIDDALDSLPFFLYMVSAGNDGATSCNPLMYARNIYGVGAYMLVNNNEAMPPFFSSESDAVDWAAPTMFYVQTPTTADQVNGTSFSGPWQAGMAAIVQDFFHTKIGRYLTRNEMVNFFNHFAVDIGAAGKDDKTGYGAVVLPDPATINPWEWILHMTIEMPLGSKTITVDGQPLTLDTAITYDPATSRLLGPVRDLYELAGFHVEWDDARKTAILTK